MIATRTRSRAKQEGRRWRLWIRYANGLLMHVDTVAGSAEEAFENETRKCPTEAAKDWKLERANVL